MNPETLKNLAAIIGSIAAILIGFYGVVTRPLMSLFKSELGRVEAKLRTDLVEMELRLKTDIHDVEKRLNDRIDARLALR